MAGQRFSGVSWDRAIFFGEQRPPLSNAAIARDNDDSAREIFVESDNLGIYQTIFLRLHYARVSNLKNDKLDIYIFLCRRIYILSNPVVYV